MRDCGAYCVWSFAVAVAVIVLVLYNRDRNIPCDTVELVSVFAEGRQICIFFLLINYLTYKILTTNSIHNILMTSS